MDVSKVLSDIDAEIARLQQARTAIAAIGGESPIAKKRGRPVGSVNAKKAAKPTKKKRNLTPEGRKRIADAMKRRWAERRKESSK